MTDLKKEKQIIDDVHKILKQRAIDLGKEKSRKNIISQKKDSYFVFKFGDDLFAIKMDDIEEIHDVNEITPLPCTPSYILGMTNLRGSIISVLDLKDYIKTKSNVTYSREKSAFFVIKALKFTCSFIVSEIIEKIELDDDMINSIGSDNKKDNYINQSFKYGRRSVGILNIKKLLNNEDFIIDN